MKPPLRRALFAAAGAALLVALAALCLRLFGEYLAQPQSDHALHVRFARRLVVRGELLPHFLYHLLVAGFAGFSALRERLVTAAAVVLTLLVLAKVALSLALLRELAARAGARLAEGVALALAVVLFFVAPLPKWWSVENVYLGQLSPTVWHNPTVIALVPLALATFRGYLAAASATGPRPRAEAATGVLLALSALAKPNFALAFVPATVLFDLSRRDLHARSWLLRFAPAAAVLGWQSLHALGPSGPAPGELWTLAPFAAWRLYSPHPSVSLLVSLAFPLAVALFAWRDLRLQEPLAAAWLVMAMALAQFVLLAEPGERIANANYSWAVVPACLLLFVVSIAELLAPRALDGRGRRAARAACWALLALHAASGVWLYAWPYQLKVS